jgi:hypothetical protein
MKRLVLIPDEFVHQLKQDRETGLGYQVVSVTLKDGSSFEQVATSEGSVIAVRGHDDIPFGAEDVARVSVNHKRWNFRDSSDTRRKAKAASN